MRPQAKNFRRRPPSGPKKHRQFGLGVPTAGDALTEHHHLSKKEKQNTTILAYCTTPPDLVAHCRRIEILRRRAPGSPSPPGLDPAPPLSTKFRCGACIGFPCQHFFLPVLLMMCVSLLCRRVATRPLADHGVPRPVLGDPWAATTPPPLQ